MLCPNCKMKNRDTARYCIRCGWWLKAKCPFCQTDLPVGVFFCDQCGRQLATQATIPQSFIIPSPTEQVSNPVKSAPSETFHTQEPVIGPELLPEADSDNILHRFVPSQLFEKLQYARARGEMVGERRIVTMLFCDVKGSTAAAQQLDPEDWTEIMNGAFGYMIQPVYKYEGTIARLMGDAILAFFGAPIAHEDDPRRAVLAGLEIQSGIQDYRIQMEQRWGIDFKVRVGINTGLVVVGAVGSDLRMEYSALGDAINIAARMEQNAQPGTVQIAHDTYKLVQPYFEFENLGGIQVKGESKPVPAFRVLAPRLAPGSSRGIEGLVSTLVGRDHELTTLHDSLVDLTQGVGHIVCLTGEAGMGKSRLIEEARKVYLELTSANAFWITVGGVSFETNHAYALTRSMLEQMSNLNGAATLSSEEIADRVLAGTLESDNEQAAQVIEILFGLQSASESIFLEGEAFKDALIRSIQAIFRSRFQETPAVLVCDDLHWADSASVQRLANLFGLVEEIPIMLILAMRPERSSAAWQLKTQAEENFHHRYTELNLQPFDEEDSNDLVNSLLAIPDLTEELRQHILERTAGNPFFIEEVIRNLIENGILVREVQQNNGQAQIYWRTANADTTLEIPDNLQSLLSARIDRLEEDARQTVQLASIIGQSFYQKVLAALEENDPETKDHLEKQLKKLIRAELIQEAARIPDLEYRFRNPLIQETAYHAILFRRRRELHRLVANAYESLFPDRLVEFSTRLSYHCLEAQDYKRALKYLTMAGDAAYRLFAITEAIQHYTQALNIVQKGEATAEQITHLYLRRGRALELGSQFENAMANYHDMEVIAAERQDKIMELEALVAQGTLYSTANVLFDSEKAEDYAQRGLDLARSLDNGAVEAKILWNVLNLNRLMNRMPEALEAGEQSLKLARQLNLREQLAYTLNDIYWVYVTVGDFTDARSVAAEARKLWEELGNKAMLADNIASTVMFLAFGGNLDTAIADAQKAHDMASSIHNLWGISFSRMFIGAAYWERGDFCQAIDVLQECIEYGDQSGFLIAQTSCRFELCLVYALLGQGERGLAMVDSLLEQPNYPEEQKKQYLYLLWQTYLVLGKLDEAEVEFANKIDEYKGELMLPFMYEWAQNEFLLAKGDYQKAIESAQGTLNTLKNYGIQLIIPDTLLVLGKAQHALGNSNAARAALQEAQVYAEKMKLDWVLWQIYTAQSAVEAQDGNPTLAEEYRANAQQIVDKIAQKLDGTEFKVSFLNRQVIREIYSP